MIQSGSLNKYFACEYKKLWYLFLFFQAEDGIRARNVTGVQTCALPIFHTQAAKLNGATDQEIREARFREATRTSRKQRIRVTKIGRASCRERVETSEVDATLEKKLYDSAVYDVRHQREAQHHSASARTR